MPLNRNQVTAKAVAAALTNIALSQTLAGAGPLVLNGAANTAAASVTASAGAAITALIGCTAATATSTGPSAAITAVTGYISPGDVLTDGTNSATVLSQVSGTTGGAGTYNLVAAPTPGAWVSASLTGTSTVLDATAVTGLISPGSTDVLTGSGVTTATITGQISGTAGGIGLYQLSGLAQKHASESMTVSSTLLDVTVLGSGSLNSSGTLQLSGTNVTQGSTLGAQQTGSVGGGIGLYSLSPSQQFASTTVSAWSQSVPLTPAQNVVISSGGDDHLLTWTITGFDYNGTALSETLAGTSGSTSTSKYLYASVSGISANGATASTVTAGVSGTVYSPWLVLGAQRNHYQWTQRAFIAAGASASYNVEVTSDINLMNQVGGFADDVIDILSAETGNTTSYNTTPWMGIRLKCNAGGGTGLVTLRALESRTA